MQFGVLSSVPRVCLFRNFTDLTWPQIIPRWEHIMGDGSLVNRLI
jgi:hypothetical protein